MAADEQPSTRPYLLRALHEWCTDNGFTPYMAVQVDSGVRVPMEFVKNDEIVLNVSYDATNGLRIGNEAVEFKARFGGIARDIYVPISHVLAIYARENGQGMAFPAPSPQQRTAPDAAAKNALRSVSSGDPDGGLPDADKVSDDAPSPSDEPPPPRPVLKRVK